MIATATRRLTAAPAVAVLLWCMGCGASDDPKTGDDPPATTAEDGGPVETGDANSGEGGPPSTSSGPAGDTAPYTPN